MNFLKFSHEKLSVEAVNELVTASSCGAISLFVGSTRDNFGNKKVISLEYEAYEPMALKCMETICSDVRQMWPEVENIAIYHRLGTVPVKEASILIATSSPHREDAIKATEWCINTFKKSVPVWKKEVYSDSKPEWKENKESEISYPPKRKKVKLVTEQKVDIPYVAPHLVQIKASTEEINNRIEKFVEKKRNDINVHNIREFCCGDRNSEFICARVDAVLQKRKDSKSHLQVNRVLNNYQCRDQTSSDYLTKFIPPNGVEERIENLECQLSLNTAVPKNIYKRLKLLEDRMLLLESISPEYIQFWDRTGIPIKSAKKKIFSLREIDDLIAKVEENI